MIECRARIPAWRSRSPSQSQSWSANPRLASALSRGPGRYRTAGKSRAVKCGNHDSPCPALPFPVLPCTLALLQQLTGHHAISHRRATLHQGAPLLARDCSRHSTAGHSWACAGLPEKSLHAIRPQDSQGPKAIPAPAQAVNHPSQTFPSPDSARPHGKKK